MPIQTRKLKLAATDQNYHNDIFENIDIQKYVEHIGLKLVNVSDRRDIVYHFTIVNSDTINMMAAPGGYIYLTKGMLLKIKNEHIVKIIDLMPEDASDLNKIFTDVSLTEDETKKILEAVKQFK